MDSEWRLGGTYQILTNDIFTIQPSQLESTYAALQTHFAEEKVFIEIVNSLLELDHGSSLKLQKQAKHKAKGYMIEEGQLWRIGDGSVLARPRLECVTQEETVALALEEHWNNGHFHRDNIKANLLNRIMSLKMDQSITKAILNCGKCKGFGMMHLHLLLEPITRRHPLSSWLLIPCCCQKGRVDSWS